MTEVIVFVHRDDVVDEVPAIVHNGCLLCRCCLPYSPIPVVILVGEKDNIVRRNRSKTVRRIVCICVRVEGFVVERRRTTVHETLTVEVAGDYRVLRSLHSG